MGPVVLRDNLCVTGVHASSHVMAVGRDGQLIIKVSNRSLLYYDINDISIQRLELSKMNPIYSECQIFEISFLRNGNLLLVLTQSCSKEILICEATIDLQEKLVDISGTVHKTKIYFREERKISLVQDEAGVVIVSYPIRWKTSENTVELFHASNFLEASAGEKYTISLTTKDKISNVIFCNPFISRNHLYLFDATNFSRFLLVPLTGSKCGKCEVRSTHGAPPSYEYLLKPLIVFEDFILIYAHMHRSSIPNLHMLNLTNLKWYPLHLALSHHYPAGKVCFAKASEDVIYLHGDCNVANCLEKSHLYQINVDAISALLMTRTHTTLSDNLSLSSLPRMVRRTSSLSQFSLDSPSATSTTFFPASPVCTKAADPPIQRYKKRIENKNNRFPLSKSAGGEEDKLLYDEPLKKSSSCSSVHWGADMAEQNGSSMQRQMKTALDMGYPEQVVMDAFTANGTASGGNPKELGPFDTYNNMLDVLQRVSGRGSSETTRFRPLSIYDENASNENTYRSLNAHPRSSSVNRSSSFSGPHLRNEQDRKQDLCRIINALDKEKDRDKQEFEQHFSIMKKKIEELESILESTREEKNRLSIDDETKSKTLKEQMELITRLEIKSKSQIEVIDKLTIDKLKLERDVERQKELADHRGLQYQNLLRDKDREEDTLKNQLEQLRSDLEIKKSLLDEQTSITKRLEDQRNSLQSSVLLEKIAETSSIILQKKEEHDTIQKELLENSIKHQKEVQIELEKIQELYKQVVTQLHSMEKEHEKELLEKQQIIIKMEENALNMSTDIVALKAKVSECCICITNKANVVLIPCMHLVVCTECIPLSLTQRPTCPLCRSNIHDTINVFV